ncbi:hypothetical protein BOX15_Mlig004026g2, partial [Macrostomum lignano]
ASLVSPTPSAERRAYLVGPVRSWQPTALADCNGSTAPPQPRSTAVQQPQQYPQHESAQSARPQ